MRKKISILSFSIFLQNNSYKAHCDRFFQAKTYLLVGIKEKIGNGGLPILSLSFLEMCEKAMKFNYFHKIAYANFTDWLFQPHTSTHCCRLASLFRVPARMVPTPLKTSHFLGDGSCLFQSNAFFTLEQLEI